jgi:PAS domain-containing protein
VKSALLKLTPWDLVETVREGLLVLDSDLTIRFANRTFCHTFAVTPEEAVGRKLHELGDGQWDILELYTALETIISGGKSIEAFEVEGLFPSIGRRLSTHARFIGLATRYNRSFWRSKMSPSA